MTEEWREKHRGGGSENGNKRKNEGKINGWKEGWRRTINDNEEWDWRKEEDERTGSFFFFIVYCFTLHKGTKDRLL